MKIPLFIDKMGVFFMWIEMCSRDILKAVFWGLSTGCKVYRNRNKKAGQNLCPAFRTLRFSQRTKYHLTFFTVLICCCINEVSFLLVWFYSSPKARLSARFLLVSSKLAPACSEPSSLALLKQLSALSSSPFSKWYTPWLFWPAADALSERSK